MTLSAVLLLASPPPAAAACRTLPEPWPAWSVTGVVGCSVWGEGVASMWAGPGVARNDCEWPWTACAPIRVTSLATGRSVVVAPTMWGDLYTGTARERIVDLDPAAVAALGLDPALGLWPVRVEPAGPALPNTAMGGPS